MVSTAMKALPALLDRMARTKTSRSKEPFPAPALIPTAEALIASKLTGDALEEAFDALSLSEQRRYVNHPERALQVPYDDVD